MWALHRLSLGCSMCSLPQSEASGPADWDGICCTFAPGPYCKSLLCALESKPQCEVSVSLNIQRSGLYLRSPVGCRVADCLGISLCRCRKGAEDRSLGCCVQPCSHSAFQSVSPWYVQESSAPISGITLSFKCCIERQQQLQQKLHPDHF